jgi:outer membrane receptor protein involved in Fe transport
MMQPNLAPPRRLAALRFVPLALLGLAPLAPAPALRAQTQPSPVADTATVSSGSIDGTLLPPAGTTGKSVEGITVTIVETGQETKTDRYGHYDLGNVAPGTYTLIAHGDGYSRLRITDVVVQPNHTLTISAQIMPMIVKDGEVQMMEEVVVHANKENVQVMEKYIVEEAGAGGAKPPPFSDANLDIPRGINDVQPYFIFDSKTIDLSGATSTEDFLRTRLTMNTTTGTNTANMSSYGTSSVFSLNGLPSTETLVLINGRRTPPVYVAGSLYQPDLNGIPLSAIDRIEVLPTSASAIYGGSAVGGVINVVLKKNYTGGEVRLSYDSSVAFDDSIRRIDVNWGGSFENGRTHVMITAERAEQRAMNYGDRPLKGIFERNLARVLANYPAAYYSPTVPFEGAAANISSGTSANLVLRNGTTLTSNYTTIPAGTTPTTAAATLYAGLAANAGTYNMALPDINGNSTGTRTNIGYAPLITALTASVSREMAKNVSAYVDFSYNSNKGVEDYNGWFSQINWTVPATAPTNPFTTSVVVKFPAEAVNPRIGPSITTTVDGGLKARLPAGWIADLDYTWSENRAGTYLIGNLDQGFINSQLASGAINPFVDQRVSPIPPSALQASNQYENFSFFSTQDDTTLAASGPVPVLPWGAPTLTIGLEDRFGGQQNGYLEEQYSGTTTSSLRRIYFGLAQGVKSAYAEADIPLVRKHAYPMLDDLELQAAARTEHFDVATGTPYAQISPITGAVSYGAPTINGAPFRSAAHYVSTNPTIGLKYQPVSQLILRGSYSKAFLPPTASQLIRNPLPDSNPSSITDPRNGTTYTVQTISGGNPGLTPQNSKSWNFGVIWQPDWEPLKGLRFDAEYFDIRQFDAIGSLSAAQIVALGSEFADRITRDPTTGLVTLVDTSSLNLYEADSKGWNLTLDYRKQTPAGTFGVSVLDSIMAHDTSQYSLTDPAYDVAGYPEEGGALKNRWTTTLSWQDSHWSATWSIRYFGSYHLYGAQGGRLSKLYGGGNNYGTYVTMEGSPTVPSQTYNDVTLGYAFGTGSGRRILDGLSIQVGVKNVFNKIPPFDAGPYGVLMESPYGDLRLRDFWISVKRAF